MTNNFPWHWCAYQEKTKEIFKQTTTEIPTPNIEDFKRKLLTLLNDIGGDWFINTMYNPKLTTNKTKLSKKQQEEEDKIKGELKAVCDHWKYWIFNIHWKIRICRVTLT